MTAESLLDDRYREAVAAVHRRDEPFPQRLPALELLLGVVRGVTALFLHRTPSQRYQVFNLSRSIQTEQALPTWEKAFAVVLDRQCPFRHARSH